MPSIRTWTQTGLASVSVVNNVIQLDSSSPVVTLQLTDPSNPVEQTLILEKGNLKNRQLKKVLGVNRGIARAYDEQNSNAAVAWTIGKPNLVFQ